MWVKYSSNVAFVALIYAYAATLLVGWSWAGEVPFVAKEGQASVFTAALSVLLVAWPIWLVHWLWAVRSWVWESEAAQYYLAFFTLVGLGAAVVVGVQLIQRLLGLALGTAGPTWNQSASFLFGATWSVVWSLAVWAYHGLTWLTYRERRRLPAQARPSAA
jgi:hypothetical protein